MRFEHGRVGERAFPGRVHQLAVRAGSPQEEGQPRREVVPGQRVDLSRTDPAGLALHAEEEVRTGEDRLQRGPDPGLKAPLVGAHLKEVEEVVHFVAVELAAVGAGRQPRDDLAGARPRLGGRRGPAGEHPPPRLEVRHARGVVRALERQAHEVGDGCRAVAGLGPREGPVVGTDQVLVRPVHLADECGRHAVLASADEDRLRADGEVLAALEVDVAAVPNEGHAFARDRDVDVVEALAPAGHESHVEGVLAVRREGVEDADAPPRTERRPFDTLPFVLGDGGWIGVGNRRGGRVTVADRAPRDFAGRVQVCVHQCG